MLPYTIVSSIKPNWRDRSNPTGERKREPVWDAVSASDASDARKLEQLLVAGANGPRNGPGPICPGRDV